MSNEYLRIFRAFSDATRVRVLELLCEGEQCACVLLEDMKISQPTLSHHMKILCESGIVKYRQVGRWRYYSINADGCEHGGRLLKALANHKMDQALKIAVALHLALSPVRKRSRLPVTGEGRQGSRRRCCDV
jgi:Predicted transcriptional regulators